jgi:hypothetical protein
MPDSDGQIMPAGNQPTPAEELVVTRGSSDGAPGVPILRLKLEGMHPPPPPAPRIPKWVVAALWVLIPWFVTSVPTVVILLYQLMDMKAQVGTMDARIDTRIADKAEGLRKDADAKVEEIRKDAATQVANANKEASIRSDRTAIEVSALRHSTELDTFMKQAICAGDPAGALEFYKLALQRIESHEIHDAMKPAVYRQLIDAILLSQKYTFLSESEIAKVEAVFRKDVTFCGSHELPDLALLWLVNGKPDKARLVAMTAATAIRSTEEEGVVVAGSTPANYYGTLLLIDLYQQPARDSDARVQATWKLLVELETKQYVRPTLVHDYYSTPEVSKAIAFAAIQQGGSFSEAVGLLRQKLTTRDFRLSHYHVLDKDGKSRVVPQIEEVPAETGEPPRPKPKPKDIIMPEPKPKCSADVPT